MNEVKITVVPDKNYTIRIQQRRIEELEAQLAKLQANYHLVCAQSVRDCEKTEELQAQLESVRNCKYVIVNGMEFCLRDDIKRISGEK